MKVDVKRSLAAVLISAWLCGVAAGGLAGRIGLALKSPVRKDFAIHILEADSETVVYGYNANQPMIPASNMKLVTTAAALVHLGADFEYKTRVGLCEDTLVVIGSGDPLLGDERIDEKYGRDHGWVLDAIAEALHDRGIEEINDVIVDSTVFDDERVHPSWAAKDLNRWYACEVCGINYNDNCIKVTTNNLDGKVTVWVEPQTSFVEIVNEIEAISTGKSGVGAYRNATPNKITLRGKCRGMEGMDVAIEKPAAFLGYVLAEHLLRAGISTRGRLMERAFDMDRQFVELVAFTTPIADVLHRSNKNSLNLASEALLKTIAAHDSPDEKGGSWGRGAERIARYLSHLGVPREEFTIDDGSGLSRENRLSANTVTTVLLDMYERDDWPLFRDSLSVGGVDGTVDEQFRAPKYRGKVLAKTGTIAGVKSLSGVCLTDRGPCLFSILSNRYSLSPDRVYGVAEAIIDEYAADDEEDSETIN